MDKRILKYPLNTKGRVTDIELPIGNYVCHVATQEGRICLWVEVDLEQEKMHKRTFEIIVTGGSIPKGAVYLQTVQLNGLVLHIHEVYTK